uniref:Uncharacterized protein n=1 Tax=Pseudomonas phage Nican01 TaxID=3138540 RepID=A0AAU6W175_9CAUD
MFRTNHTKMAFFVAGMVVMGIAWQISDLRNKEPELDMNDRIIAQATKCAQAGMESSTESNFAVGDKFYVVCKPAEFSMLDKLTLQLILENRAKAEASRNVKTPAKPANPDSFEAKSKVTQ